MRVALIKDIVSLVYILYMRPRLIFFVLCERIQTPVCNHQSSPFAMAATILCSRSAFHQASAALRRYRNVIASGISTAGNTHDNLARPLPTQSWAFRRCLSTDDSLRSAVSLQLRPYQLEAAKSCVEALQRGRRRIGVSLPTGSGKTAI